MVFGSSKAIAVVTRNIFDHFSMVLVRINKPSNFDDNPHLSTITLVLQYSVPAANEFPKYPVGVTDAACRV